MKIILKGAAASPGKIKGKVRVIKKQVETNIEIEKGEIIVISFVTPFVFNYIFKAGAIITDHGGITSHAANIARELGIPCIVGTEKATQILKDGTEVIVDGDNGIVYKE